MGGKTSKRRLFSTEKFLQSVGYPTNKDFDLKTQQRQVILLLFSGTLKGFGLTN